MPRENPWTTKYHTGSKPFARLPKRSRKKTAVRKERTKIVFNKQKFPMITIFSNGTHIAFVLRQSGAIPFGGQKRVLKVATGSGNTFSGLRLATKNEITILLKHKAEIEKKAGWDFSKIIIPSGKPKIKPL